MDNNKLYIFQHEEEDDPYCAHWYETDWMTTDYDECIKRMTERHNTLTKDRNNDRLSKYDGFCKVYQYDLNKKEYIYSHIIFLNKSQIYTTDFILSNIDDLMDMFKNNRSEVQLDYYIYCQILDVPIEKHLISKFKIIGDDKENKEHYKLQFGNHIESVYKYTPQMMYCDYMKKSLKCNGKYDEFYTKDDDFLKKNENERWRYVAHIFNYKEQSNILLDDLIEWKKTLHTSSK